MAEFRVESLTYAHSRARPALHIDYRAAKSCPARFCPAPFDPVGYLSVPTPARLHSPLAEFNPYPLSPRSPVSPCSNLSARLSPCTTLSVRPQHHPGPTLPDWWLQGRHPVSPAPAPPWSDPPGVVAAGAAGFMSIVRAAVHTARVSGRGSTNEGLQRSSRHTAAATTAQLAAAQRSGEPRNSAGWAADGLAGC